MNEPQASNQETNRYAVAYRTDQRLVICVRCAETVKLLDYSAMTLAPISRGEAEWMCHEDECICAECGYCVLVIANRRVDASEVYRTS